MELQRLVGDLRAEEPVAGKVKQYQGNELRVSWFWCGTMRLYRGRLSSIVQ